ncbi:PAS domain-containing protein [Azospirillum sp. HJ39]|uniref:PAS domain-containing protein n=1 Tax=Azospirillum sp. HJ39 TaxID=3159496 RepID=UPI0035582E90
MTKERTELATPYLSGLLEFWLTKSVAGRPPVPSSIAPADLRPWKDNIVVFEVIGEESGTFVYSYYGRALVAAFGQSRLGATLDDLPPEQRAVLQPEYETVRRERLPVARVHTAVFGGRTRSFERLVLPMSSDGTSIDKLLVAAYEMTPRELAARPPVPSQGHSPGHSPAPGASSGPVPLTVQKPGASA